MSNITELIKELRNTSGAGFLDEFLRKKGLAKASKKSSIEANEGAVGCYTNNDTVAILKINSETDFAAKSETFLNFLDELGNFAVQMNNHNISIDQFLELDFKGAKINDYFKTMIAKIGENLILSNLLVLNVKNSSFSYYVHNSYKKHIGKILSLIIYESDKSDEDSNELSKNLCMHIAAMKPESLDIDDLDKDLIDKERNIQKELIINSGKPSAIVEKILEGKMKKFFSEVTLLNQNYILDPEKVVKSVITDFSKGFIIKSFKIVSL